MAENAQGRVLLGRVQGLFGVRGWIKLYSYTAPPENIFDYRHWQLLRNGQLHALRLVEGRVHGKALIAQIADEQGHPIDDRDVAAQWLDADIYVARSKLPPPEPGKYYAAELLGFAVQNQQGVALGEVADFMETGANPVMLVRGEREHLIPFIRKTYILAVDLHARAISVDWDADF